MGKKQEILKSYYGHSDFRPGQEKIIDCLLSGRDALCIMPTGAGKSICYQVPALIMSGITIVVSPLISLMKDQVSALCQVGVAAAYLNSSLTSSQYVKALKNMGDGKYKIIYVAPERLGTSEFLNTCTSLNISMVAVDEAHCVSQWGQDFRPSYLKIIEFINALPNRPVVSAFTATATNDVRDDILKILALENPFVITTGFNRPNLFFSVVKPQSKQEELLSLIKERRDKSGIVYCATRKSVEEVCRALNIGDYSATQYHAGLTDDERRQNQEDFVYDRKQIMVATNAFGMGIDKSNVSFVIHYNMPKNIESYYQEAGRAGRDGQEADCILLYSPSDVRLNQFLIDKSKTNADLSPQELLKIRRLDSERLKFMTFYSTTSDCLRNYILKYFGEKGECYCGKCSNCLTKFETVDITNEAHKIFQCIVSTGQHFGRTVIINILKGSKNEKVVSFGLAQNPLYGAMSDTAEKQIRGIIDWLIEKKYIELYGNEYPVCKLSFQGSEALNENLPIQMKKPKEQIKTDNKRKGKAEMNESLEMMGALKKLRREIAEKEKVPAYIVFSDASLIDMCKKQPITNEEFLDISGVGKTKLLRYGEEFMQLIRKFSER